MNSIRLTVTLLAASALMVVSAEAQQAYENSFDTEAFPFMAVTRQAGEWNLNTDNGTLTYTHLRHVSHWGHGTGSVRLPGWDTEDFRVTSRFTVQHMGTTGSAIFINVDLFAPNQNLGPLDVTTSGAYGFRWLGGGSPNAGNMMIQRLGANQGDWVTVGIAQAGRTYEFVIEGTHNNGSIDFNFSIYDVTDGRTLIGNKTLSDPDPLTDGEWFGIRNITQQSAPALTVDYDYFSMLPLNPPFITGVNPAHGQMFHPAAEGLRFTASTTAENVISPSGIDLVLNGQSVPSGELAITGSSPSIEVLYDGLEPNTDYTAQLTVSDSQGQRSIEWSFRTLHDQGVAILEDLALNQSTVDSLQGRVPHNSYAGTLPESGNIARLTDATSSSAPTASVIPGPDDSTVILTWDLSDVGQGAHVALEGLNIWITGNDPWRTGFDGEVAVSSDGETFTVLPNSRIATALTYTGATMTIDEEEVAGTGTNNFNLVSYVFDPAEFTDGITHLRLISHGFDNLNEGILRQSRFVEVDGFLSISAPRIVDVTPESGAIFHPVGAGIQFTVETDPGGVVLPADVQLFLNGTAVSASELSVTGSSPVYSVSYTGQLAANLPYTARAEVRDDQSRRAVLSWSFDTFSEEGMVVIEAEDYNFAADIGCDAFGDPQGTPLVGGAYFNNPVPSAYKNGQYHPSDRENAYVDRVGVPGIDFNDRHTQGSPPGGGSGDVNNTMYRFCDPVGTVETDDAVRPKYEEASVSASINIPDYHVHRVQTGEWLNYTRDVPEGLYNVFLRARVVSGSPSIRLDRVTSDPSAGGQETEFLGNFIPAGSGSFTYIQLTDEVGQPAILSVSGQETFRLTAVSANNNIDLNFFALVPATFLPPAVVSLTPEHGASEVTHGATIEAVLERGSAGLDLDSLRLFVNGQEAAATVSGSSEIATLSYTHGNLPFFNNTARIEFDDVAASGPYSAEWTFSVGVHPMPMVWGADGFRAMTNFSEAERKAFVEAMYAQGVPLTGVPTTVYVRTTGTGETAFRVNPGSIADQYATTYPGTFTDGRGYYTDHGTGRFYRGGGADQTIYEYENFVDYLLGETGTVVNTSIGGNAFTSNLDGTRFYRIAPNGDHLSYANAALTEDEQLVAAINFTGARGAFINPDTGDFMLVAGNGTCRNYGPAEPPTYGGTFVQTGTGFGGGSIGHSAITLSLGSPPAAGSFVAWAAGFGLPPGQDGPYDNPSGDGISNIVKYALGADPTVADRSILPIGSVEVVDARRYLTLAVWLNPEAADVSLLVEVSADLVDWFSGPEHTTVIPGAADELIVRDNVAIDEANRRFIRLLVIEE